ncbi:hypothetical protein ACFO9Q_15235 [Paenibacillus sp. GCM10023252]|uniref:hypothetical protein n=1 Tax=Paenibacillus sp. GCM10023252 TaxID=3252649 RepID=UPI0036098641
MRKKGQNPYPSSPSPVFLSRHNSDYENSHATKNRFKNHRFVARVYLLGQRWNAGLRAVFSRGLFIVNIVGMKKERKMFSLYLFWGKGIGNRDRR